MSDADLRERLQSLVPEIPRPSDPVGLLAPRIKRRRLARLGGAVVLASVLIFSGVFAVAAVHRGHPGGQETVRTANGGLGDLGDLKVGQLYPGPPFPEYAGQEMWVVADGHLGGTSTQWVLLNFLDKGDSCTMSGIVPRSPTATTTEYVSGYCGSARKQLDQGPSTDLINKPSGGPGRVLITGEVANDVRVVRAVVSKGTLLNRTVRTGASPANTGGRFYAFDAGPGGIVGTLTYFNAAGQRIGHVHVDNAPDPSVPPAIEARGLLCPSHSFSFNTHTNFFQCLQRPQPWEESAAAITAYSVVAVLIAALSALVWRRRRRRYRTQS